MNYFYLERQLLDPFPDSEILPRTHRARTLNDLLAAVLTESLRGPPCDKHARLASLTQEGDVVFSFNYDVLIDHALYNADKLSDSGYGIRLDYTHFDGEWHETKDAGSKVALLKLHGSMNWLRCGLCGRNLLLRTQKYLEATLTLGEEAVSCPKCGASPLGPRFALERIIIPPAAIKSFGDVDVRYLWSRASSYCRNVNRIIVIGYQFAPSDYELEALLRDMAADKNHGQDLPITIVNPSPSYVAGRFASIFSKSNITKRRTLRSFLDHSVS